MWGDAEKKKRVRKRPPTFRVVKAMWLTGLASGEWRENLIINDRRYGEITVE